MIDPFGECEKIELPSLRRGRFYPGTGASAEVGREEGEGYTVNVPWSTGRKWCFLGSFVASWLASVLWLVVLLQACSSVLNLRPVGDVQFCVAYLESYVSARQL